MARDEIEVKERQESGLNSHEDCSGFGSEARSASQLLFKVWPREDPKQWLQEFGGTADSGLQSHRRHAH